MMFGTLVISGGVWSVVWTHMAHTFIYVGSVFVMFAALLLVIYSWGKLIKDRIAEQGIENPNFGQKFIALFHDPIKFGPFLADGLHELHCKWCGYLHGGQIGTDLSSLASA